ncbi:ubiquitin carboxyl-terminal hydrolase 47-like isoform X2 [Megalobrama amblycephala]|uniref:ubiquitin carboxyl-terminal hydrolase 47-like isoform X2 n=1 Tax=Megalobrama amblycephala TaxID=75352 RepID=UPI00201400A2|nr:ubiquitin carboxyl-terminal hydrolase 47-like isoform X2 [Megalobrama amblycephala]
MFCTKDKPRDVKGSYRGLNSQGATSYLNAILQVLFMTRSFRERVMGASSDTNENLVSALKKIFQELSNQYSGAPSVSTRGIITSLGIQNVNEQQDAVEYFQDILEKVDSTLAEDFSGTLRNIRKCSHHHVSHDDSPFKSLQIPVITRDGQFKLEDGLNKYFESTILDEDAQMYCNDCDEKRDTTLSIEIHEYPEILPLHLKRFEYDYRVRGFVKNDCPMDVPLHLSLQGHKYSLYAVINHTGTRFRGHYTAVIRSFTDNKWYHFNDSRVTLTDESELKRSGEAYLLLYQKSSEPVSPLPEPAAGPSTSAAVLTAPPGRRVQRRVSEQPSEVERQLIEALRTRPVAPAPPPRSEDELFLLSLVPSLQRLPPQTKEFVKFQIHKLIYESSTVVLNLEQVEPTE